MSVSRILLFLLFSGAIAARPGIAAPPAPELPATNLTSRQQAFHLLNRAAFGPRPGEIEQLARGDLSAWIQRQLHPGRIPDPAIPRRLERLPAPGMTVPELYGNYTPLQARVRHYMNQGMSKEDARNRAKEDGSKDARRAADEMAMQRLVRAVYSERQLEEIMVDFWANHFNVFSGKNLTPLLLPMYERETLRPYAFGSFEDLLKATAMSPAMLLYLDNFQSMAGPASERLGRGLNENYARELLELHTLGVDGGYTEADVREVARCFTGWTFHVPRGRDVTWTKEGRPNIPERSGQFEFRRRAHDNGGKVVLGRTVKPGGGIEDGFLVLEWLARHPATARNISNKLAVRFVSDTPPSSLVDRMAETFRQSDGDIRSVLQTMLYSPEFWSLEAYRSKVKTPLELVASALRGTGAEFEPTPAVYRQLRLLGEIPYGYAPPTGHPDTAEDWISPGALMDRMNFGLALAANRLPGARIPESAIDSKNQAERWLSNLLAGEAAAPTRTAVLQAAQGDLDEPGSEQRVRNTKSSRRQSQRMQKIRALGLVLGSPDFQRQ